MIWLVILIVLFLASAGGVSFLSLVYARAQAKVLRDNVAVLRIEKEQKESITKELIDILLSFVTKDDYEKLNELIDQASNELQENQSKLQIATTELERSKERVGELEEVSRELEASALEASRELETLKKQELELGSQTEKIKVELDHSLSELDRLLEQLSHSQAAVHALNKTKTELLESQEKVIWYQERISEINIQYAQLKKAYDALDIEYAQLYEKQNA